jgi:hypothetical protein
MHGLVLTTFSETVPFGDATPHLVRPDQVEGPVTIAKSSRPTGFLEKRKRHEVLLNLEYIVSDIDSIIRLSVVQSS